MCFSLVRFVFNMSIIASKIRPPELTLSDLDKGCLYGKFSVARDILDMCNKVDSSHEIIDIFREIKEYCEHKVEDCRNNLSK
jgi:hypothetical protein